MEASKKLDKHDKRFKRNRTDTRELLANTNLVKSQTNSEFYHKITKENQLSKFIAYVQYCSQYGYDITKTVETLRKAFPFYISKKEFNEETFKALMQTYPDIAVAWGYGVLGDEVAHIQIKNKALGLALKTESLEDIEIYHNLYNAVDKIKEEDNKTVFNFNIRKEN